MVVNDGGTVREVPPVTVYGDNSGQADKAKDRRACGWLLTPGWLLVVLTIFGVIQQMACLGFVEVGLTSIERRFGITSSQAGFLVSFYQITSVLMLVPIHIFGHNHKTLWLGIAAILQVFASVLFFLPHLIIPAYSPMDQRTSYCSSGEDPCPDESGSSLFNYYYLFIVSQGISGFGYAAIFTLGLELLDQNVSRKQSPLFLGILSTSKLSGPTVSFLVGAGFLRIPVNLKDLELDMKSTLFIGAWWLGFVMCAFVSLLLILPICYFPEYLPSVENQPIDEAQTAKESESFKVKAGVVFGKLKKLLTNPIYLVIVVIFVGTTFIIVFLSSFGIKLFYAKANLSAFMASLYFGILTVPAGILGTMIGGLVSSKMQLSFLGNCRLCFIGLFLAFLLSPTFLLSCPQRSIQFKDINSTGMPALCSSDCNCNAKINQPVCGSDEILYQSACFAGCDENKENCDCIGDKTLVEDGMCFQQCSIAILFYVLFCLFVGCAFLSEAPRLQLLLRSVEPELKGLAISFNQICLSLFGAVPAPLIAGAIFDSQCEHWLENCHGEKLCLSHDTFGVSLIFTIVISSFVLTGLVCITITYVLYSKTKLAEEPE